MYHVCDVFFFKDFFVLLFQCPWRSISIDKDYLKMQLWQPQILLNLFRRVQSDDNDSMTVEVQNFWSVGFEIAFVALKAQCSIPRSGQLEKTYLWTLCCTSGKNLALQIFWWFYSLTIENLYFSGKGAHSIILRNHRSIINLYLLFPPCI